MWAHHRRHGFTIVELLIVIVVIAILAAITIVSYNGITRQARESTTLSQLRQAEKAIEAWRVTNGMVPANLAAVGTSLNSSAYQYTTFNNGAQYCISSSSADTAYFIRSDQQTTAPRDGRCDAIDWVAGKPKGFNDTIGTNTALTGPITGTPDITMYMVVNIIDNNFAYETMAGLLPKETGNRLYFQGSTAGSTAAGYRLDTSVSSNNAGSQSGVRTPGYHIGWVQVYTNGSNQSYRSFAYDQTNPTATTLFDMGTGWTFDELELSGQSSPSYDGVAVTVYQAAHDQATRQAVMNWLAQKYSTGTSY